MKPQHRTRLRLAIRDLAAAAAFGSMAVSGSVPLFASGLFVLCLAIALWGRRPVARHPNVTAVALALAGVGIFGLVVRGGMDLVVAACAFASLVAAQRLLAEPTLATDNQVHLTGLLMLSGGAALSGEITFGLCLVAYSFLASLSLGLSVVEEATPNGEALPLRPALWALMAGAVAATLGAALFFVAFPRLSWNVAARRSSPGLGPATTGMSDAVRLGGSGQIKTNPRVVFRARLRPDPGTDRLDAYWLGRAFSTFSGREWTALGTPTAPRYQIVLSRGQPESIQQEIELLPAYEARTLVAMDPPVRFFGAGGPRMLMTEVPGEEVRLFERPLQLKYRATSSRSGGVWFDGELERYLQLPEGLDPRVTELARQVAGGERQPLNAANKLAAHLRSRYGYTLELPGEVDDPLVDFLFVRKQGHCEHFATALTVLLRSLGFPARVAAGFYGGERLEDRYLVRAGDAHAWTQVFVPGEGFVSIDATPETFRAAQPSALLAWLTGAYEWVDGWWRSRVVDYSILDQADLVRGFVRPPKMAKGGGSLLSLPRQAWLWAAIAALAVYALWRFVLLERSKQRPHPAGKLADEIEAALLRAGLRLHPGEGLEELARRLANARHPLAPAANKAIRRYLEARFGDKPLRENERKVLLQPLWNAGRAA